MSPWSKVTPWCSFMKLMTACLVAGAISYSKLSRRFSRSASKWMSSSSATGVGVSSRVSSSGVVSVVVAGNVFWQNLCLAAVE